MTRPPRLDPARYSAWRAAPLGAVTERIERRRILALAGPLEGRAVLDVGAGDGTYALAAAARGARVTAVDSDPAMLRAARARAATRGLSLTAVEGRIERLPFDDGSFDVVFAVTVLCFVTDPAAAARELARVLAPGGRLILGELGRRSVWAAWRRLRGWLGSATWRRATFRTAAELRRLVQGAGFDVERVVGAVYYPPVAAAARLLAPLDPIPAAVTTVGAAFIAVAARKPRTTSRPQGERP